MEGQRGKICPQPKSVRHFRCYQIERQSPEMSASAIEVTPLQTFLQRNEFDDTNNVLIDELVETLQQPQALKNFQIGTKVLVRNIQSKPELNGRSGIITKEKVYVVGRLHVLVHMARENQTSKAIHEIEQHRCPRRCVQASSID